MFELGLFRASVRAAVEPPKLKDKAFVVVRMNAQNAYVLLIDIKASELFIVSY